jgi:hypothetical protein
VLHTLKTVRVNMVSRHTLKKRLKHCATAAVGVPKSQLCTAAAAAPLPEGVSEQQRPESPVHAPLPTSFMLHVSAEMEHPFVVAANLSASIADPGVPSRLLLQVSSPCPLRPAF